jgi:tetratricopeptide (TPR) repeat protein
VRTVPENLLEKAMELATTGRAPEAIETLWPLMRDDESRPKALFTLAFCFERAGNHATAAYLYRQALDADPDNAIARDRMAHSRKEAEAKGVFEDFSDRGHIPCPCKALRQRAEYGACPYCGRTREGDDPLGPTLLEESEEPLPGWDDPSFAERLEDAAQLASEKIKTWLEREEVKELSSRLGQIGEEMSATAKHVAEHEKVKAASDRVQKVAHTASDRVTEFLDSESVRQAARKVREVGRETVEKAKAALKDEPRETEDGGEAPRDRDLLDRVRKFADNTEKVIDDLVANPKVQEVQKRVRDTSENVLQSVRNFLKGATKPKDPEE